MRRLEDELEVYVSSDAYPFHMPGHKRQGVLHGRNAAFEGNSPLDAATRFDITEIDGFDNLHAPEGILKEEMELAARIYGAQDTYFSVNGSTGAILAAVSAAVPKGGTMLIERSCHISVYHAAYLRDLRLLYMEEGELPEGRKGEEKISAVVLTSPSYVGAVKDVRAWAEYAHSRGALLLVDEAHGAHFSMHPAFPESAIRQGADLVVQSLHKTLPVLTQAALLHNVSGRVESAELRRFLDIYETSSPSYLLMASMTRCLHLLEEEGSRYFDNYARMLSGLRKELFDGFRHLRLKENDDPGKLQILVPPPGTGELLASLLRERFCLECEMRGPDYVLLMTSPADTEEGFRRLKEALFALDREFAFLPAGGTAGRMDTVSFSLPETVLPLGMAADAPGEEVPLAKAAGRVAKEYILVYPPDSPLIVPGEMFCGDLIRQIGVLVDQGLTLTGLMRDVEGQLRVSVLRHPLDAKENL